MTVQDQFFQAYDRDDVAYGTAASAELQSYLRQASPGGRALDLGAGAGRDALALATAGLQVDAVDLSARGLERIRQRAAEGGLSERIRTTHADVRSVEIAADSYAVVVATTVLCHLPGTDARTLWNRLAAAITDRGMIYAEVHTTSDPGSPEPPGLHNENPVSETAFAVKHYFAPGELLAWAMQTERVRVLRYEERLEWDDTHGPEHQHGKAILLAVHRDHHPPWYGHPPAFPRRP